MASSHMLKEVLDSPFADPLKSLRLPRELNPNKKYSWMQKKEERVRLPARPVRRGLGRVPRDATASLCSPGQAVVYFWASVHPLGVSRGGSLTGQEE